MAGQKRKTGTAETAKRGRKRAHGRRRSVKKTQALETALAALAHDIRTPLTGILALSELLVASEIGSRERTWAARIKDAAEHLAQLTTIVCDGVRSDATGLTLQREAFSPRRVVESVSAALSARAAATGLAAEIVIAGDLPEYVIGDAVRIRAAIENLLDNAVKFTARGGVKLEVSTRPVGRGRIRLVFSVTDSGIGLTRDEIKKLFRPFAQASEAVSRRYGGTGLGLALVKRLARAMGGDLTVASKPQVGSTFRLTVFVDRVPEGAADERKMSVTQMRKILCVEDNPYGRVVLNTILVELGYRTDFVGSGEAAVAAAAQGGFDLILMDVTLPGIDGIEAARRIRALPGAAGRVPIIGISGRDGPKDEIRARKAGMNVYLPKPLSPAALSDAIAAHARRGPKLTPPARPRAQRSVPHPP